MDRRKRFLSTAMCAFVGSWVLWPQLTSAQQYPEPSAIPVEAFAAMPAFSGARFSPDGITMAYFAGADGRKDVVVRPLSTSKGAFQIPPPQEATFQQLRWATNNVLLVQARLTMRRERFERLTTETRWFSFNLETNKFIWLGKPKISQHELPSQHERIIDILAEDDDHILLQLDLNLNGDSEVYKTNILTGARRLRRPPVDGVQNWFTDHTTDVRLGTGYNGLRWITKLKDKAGFWTDLRMAEWGSNLTIAGFSGDPDVVFVKAQSSMGPDGLYSLNLRTESIRDTIFEHETVDVDYAITTQGTNEIYGVAYTDDFPRVHFLDPERKKVKAAIDLILPNTVNTILREVKDKNRYFLRAENDQNDGTYYVYNAKSKRLQQIAKRRPNIDETLMGRVQPVLTPMRDGTHIKTYMLIPHGKPLKSLPTIIMPHGGPYGVRDTARWDYAAQFYASRGYLVVKPNFRGSGGFGKAFEEAGHNQWGGLMQDDVTDTTKWLINEGFTDAKRICIVGSSYGGYAALMGTIKEPGLYSCAISLNGVTNLAKLKSEDRRYAIGGRSWTRNMGLEGVSDNVVSPYHRAEDVSAPVLLMATEDDARVPWEMSKDMHNRLKKLNKDSTFVKIEKGTHNMITVEARLAALKAAETFLAKHIGS